MAAAQGFLLTRLWRETASGLELVFWFATDAGPRELRIPAQQAVAFVPAERRADIERLLPHEVELRELALQDFQRRPVLGLYAPRYRILRDLEQRLAALGIEVYEADIAPADRFLMERFITAPVQLPQAGERGTTPLRPAPDYRPQLRTLSLDIETSERGELYSIGLHGCGQRQVYMLGPPTGEEVALDFDLEYVADRATLLERLNAWLARHDPDVIIGWSVLQFDIRVLHEHARKLGVPLHLGRGAPEDDRYEPGGQGRQFFALLAGRPIIDGVEALKSATWVFPSYSLENVSRTLLGEGKAIDNPHDRMASINRMFASEKSALARYNLVDCELVTRIFEQTELLRFLLERASVTGLPLERHGASIAAFYHLYLPLMHRQGFVAPNLGAQPPEASPGGFVMDSRPGLYDSVLVLDYKSLYPSLIRTFLIDPVGLVEGLATPADETVPGFRGARFHRTRHCLPEMVARVWEGRDAAKRAGNAPLAQALKIIMNSFYGVLGTPHCRFFDHRLASSITLRGHAVMHRTRELIEARGHQVIYGDTDSTFVWLGGAHGEAEAERIGRELVAAVNAHWREQLQAELGLESHLELQYETHFARFLMPTIRGAEEGSKKRYAGLRPGADGQPELVFKGLETVRSDWSPLAQRFQRELYLRIFTGEPHVEYLRDFVARTRAGEFDDLLVYRKRLRRPLDEYQSNVPPQVRAARLVEAENARLGRRSQFRRGGWISYLITTAGPEPVELPHAPPDYDHYVQRQLAPVADAILPFVGDRFERLLDRQMGLF
ncbi:DNA polymerase II [Pseudomonas oryzihabitans]|uniref:DNA polymerase n=1 Tax=Pseudomonas oryzihabitans TaxID=47885 RepID=A0AAJ2BMK8_9PSED|nr:DNA polymerase II [Pseudomonas psychrotolerans]MDR6235247.1 DNA polymerase-2 [Pseudomonas psychrotolerans]